MKSWLALGPLLAMALPVVAQQNYFVPRFELSTEHHTNRELRPNSALPPPEDSNLYKATAEAFLGRATPRSDLELHPRLIYQKFPNCSCVDPLEEFMDLKSEYRSQKGRYTLNGSFSQQDTLNAELGQAQFDADSDPSTPPVLIDTGVIFVGQRRTFYEVEPSFVYSLTQLTGVGALARYQRLRYEEDPLSNRVGFKSPYVEVTLNHGFGQLTQFDIGPYFTRFEADNDLRNTDSYGARIGLHHQWTERSRVSVLLRGERDRTETFGTTPSKESSNAWGLEIEGQRKNVAGDLRYSIGRYLQPSGLGDRRETDMIKLEYNRLFSALTSFKTALRLTRDQSVNKQDQQSDRDRALLEVSLARVFTRKLDVRLGYRYAWQDLGQNIDSADDNSVFLTIGFRGLDPRKRVP